MVEETKEVKWCEVNALFSIDYDFVAGRAVMENNVFKCLAYCNTL